MVGVVDSPPRPAGNAEPAQWLLGRLDYWKGDWVTGLAGPGFDAYARVFHPLDDEPGSSRWSDVARANGRVMHSSAQWEQISSPPGEVRADAGARGRGRPGDPLIGQLDAWVLDVLSDVLARHTSTPDECFFAVWEGWGWQNPGAHQVAQFSAIGSPVEPVAPAPDGWQLDLSGPKFSLPGRDYYLFAGAVSDASRFGYWITADWFDTQSPSIFWPADHAWCVATEIDLDSTLVGGSQALITDLSGSDTIEVLRVPPDAPNLDLINQ